MEEAEERRFYLRGRELRSRAPMLIAFLPYWALAGVFVYVPNARQYDAFPWHLVMFSLVILPVLLALMFVVMVHPARNSHVRVAPDEITLWMRAGRPMRVPLERVSALSEAPVRVADFLYVSALHPWKSTVLVLPLWSKTTLCMHLDKSVPYSPWVPLPRIRKYLFDPEDRVGFIAALRQAAPHVAIEPSLVE